MAEVKNNFLKSKMNKDLDDRLVPAGEYRHAQNISVAKSEGQDVGALENILGNDLISNFVTDVETPFEMLNVDVIGYLMDIKNDRIIVFMTNYVDTSGDTLSNFSPATAKHYIGVYNTITKTSSIVVSGQFLNFSKTSEIYSVNIIEDLLFWTDNRNQPRKINIKRASSNNNYYTTEDTISVSKYYPHQTIDLIISTVTSVIPNNTPFGLGYIVQNNLTTAYVSGSGSGYGLTIDILSVDPVTGEILTYNINNIGVGYSNGDILVIEKFIGEGDISGSAEIFLFVTDISAMQDVVSEKLPDDLTDNPYRQPYGSGDITWKGDPEYLKDKFVRFSYRFKFDDGEYSLIAPFTQSCFIPKQDGYFIGDDDARTFKSTEVDFMENKVNNIFLHIISPTGDWNNIQQSMKIEEIDILYKQAGQNVIKIIDTIDNDKLRLIASPILSYNYTSSKPWKTLPESEILRVHDQVPVRAFSQELIGNRIVYGNYIDKPTPPSTINYSCGVVDKEVSTQIEYQNQNLKQNRTYQVGIVLSDKYGRQSTVILSSVDESKFSTTIKGSTLFHGFKSSPFSNWPLGSFLDVGTLPSTPGSVWDGDNLLLTFWDTISSTKNNATGEPGLYDSINNPLGWYSYKVVVKQTEQDYYNIYFPGILNGYIDGEAKSTGATTKEPVCHFTLHGDNINKVPRDLSLVGPNQKTFRSGRPSAQEDPSYYKFVNDFGRDFTVDPTSKEGEKLLKERDRERDLDSGSQITNASVKLSLRLNNVIPGIGLADNLTTTNQAYSGTNLDVVSTIGTGSELGLWDPAAIIPFNTANVFYGYKNNPYIAKISVTNPVAPDQTGITGPHPYSGVFEFNITYNSGGTGYFAPSENVPCTIPASFGYTISGFKVNIPDLLSAVPPTIADIGIGWPSIMPSGGIPPITGCKISGAGNGLALFTINVTSDSSSGKMAPSLAVYETQPLKSKLDIFWETSTNGLIEDLNTDILTGDSSTPVELVGFSSTSIDYIQNENMDIGEYTTGPIYADNAAGNPVPILSVTLLGAFDASTPSPSNRHTEFSVELNPPGSPNAFKIKSAAYFVCNRDNQVVGTFVYDVMLIVPSDTYGADGTTLNRYFTIGPHTIGNTSPTFLSLPTEGAFSAKTPEFLGTTKFNIPFSLGGFDPTPANIPYITKRIKFTNIIEDNNGVYGPFSGTYTCDTTGNYDIHAKVNLKAEFQAIGLASGKYAEMCSSLVGWLYLRDVATQTQISSSQEVCITYNRQLTGSVSGWTNWTTTTADLPEHRTGFNIYGTYGGDGYAWPDWQARPDGKWYTIVASNFALTAGDQVELVFKGGFFGDEIGGNVAYGYACKKLGVSGIGDKFYDANSWLHAVGGMYAATSLRGNLGGGLIHTYNAQNGSFNTPANSLKTDNVSFDITSDPSGLFYLDYSAGINGQVDLRNNAGGEVATAYPITIQVKDGLGATTDYNSFVLLS